jgi:hypothetical protein
MGQIMKPSPTLSGLSLLAASFLVVALPAGCGDDRPKASSGPPATTQHKVRFLRGDEEVPDEARLTDEFVATLAKGGQNWSSKDSSRVGGRDVTSEGFLLIRPVADEPLRKPRQNPLGPKNQNIGFTIECLIVPGKSIKREQGRIKAACQAELDAEGRQRLCGQPVMIGGMSQAQRVVGVWWAGQEDLPGNDGVMRIYLSDPSDPKRSLSNVLEIKAVLAE